VSRYGQLAPRTSTGCPECDRPGCACALLSELRAKGIRVRDMDAVVSTEAALKAYDEKNHDPHGTGSPKHSHLLRSFAK